MQGREALRESIITLFIFLSLKILSRNTIWYGIGIHCTVSVQNNFVFLFGNFGIRCLHTYGFHKIFLALFDAE
jgi:hypothetical protein